jgi:hypothetical protein
MTALATESSPRRPTKWATLRLGCYLLVLALLLGVFVLSKVFPDRGVVRDLDRAPSLGSLGRHVRGLRANGPCEYVNTMVPGGGQVLMVRGEASPAAIQAYAAAQNLEAGPGQSSAKLWNQLAQADGQVDAQVPDCTGEWQSFSAMTWSGDTYVSIDLAYCAESHLFVVHCNEGKSRP